jgi:hypothetical protein
MFTIWTKRGTDALSDGFRWKEEDIDDRSIRTGEVDARWSKLKISGDDDGFHSPAKKRDPMDKDASGSPVSTLMACPSSYFGAAIQVQKVRRADHDVKTLLVAVVCFAFLISTLTCVSRFLVPLFPFSSLMRESTLCNGALDIMVGLVSFW